MKFIKMFYALTFFASMSAHAYTPLLDEVEGLNGPNGAYLVLPAWENLDPAVKQKAYFIMPKYLTIAGHLDQNQPEYQFGVSHRGYTLFNNGTADYPPSMDLLAAVQVFEDDKTIADIKKQLTNRDVSAGLLPPVFPEPVFEKFEGEAVVAGVAGSTAVANASGGYPGQITLVKVTTPPDAFSSLILDTPSTAGRNAALWGVVLKGTLSGYGNRLNCQITIHHKKVYDHFKARASGQAWWGFVKSDIAAEVKSMDQDQSIDFGLCRGSESQIDKIVMPVWQKIIELSDQDGTKMFSDMIKSLNGIPNHPEAASSGWGFQASAGWEKVSYNDSTTINFNISYRTSWQLPLAMTFSTQCGRWKSYFINNTDKAKPCVDPTDYPQVRSKQRACFTQFFKDITDKYPPTVQAGAYGRLRTMGCAWDGSFSLQDGYAATLTSNDASTGRVCRSVNLALVTKWRDEGALRTEDYESMTKDVSRLGCAWRGGLELQRVNKPTASEELLKSQRTLQLKINQINQQ